MSYQIDQIGRIWLNGGIVVKDCGEPWNTYLAWLAEGNEPEPRNEEAQ